MRKDAVFGLSIPEHCPGVPDNVLDPILTWNDKEAYKTQARLLVERFEKNFAQFESQVPKDLAVAGPHLEELE